MTSQIETQLAEIESRSNAATAGPWTVGIGGRIRGPEGTIIPEGSVVGHDDADIDDTIAFIAQARQDIPALVRALRSALTIAKTMPSEAYVRITDMLAVDDLPRDLQSEYDTLEQDIAAILAKSGSSQTPEAPAR